MADLLASSLPLFASACSQVRLGDLYSIVASEIVTDQAANGKPAGKPASKPGPKTGAKTGAKDKTKEKGGAQANAATDGGGNGEYTWKPKNPFAEADGDVENEE